MRAEERHEDVVVGAGKSLKGEDLTADGNGAIEHRERLAFPRGGNADLVNARLEDLCCFGILIPDDGEASFLDDASLLTGDEVDAIAKDVGVIHRHARDHRHLRLAYRRRVPGAADTHLHHGHVDRRIRECGVCDRRERLEVGDRGATLLFHACVDSRDEGSHVACHLHEHLRGDRLSVDLDAFAHVHQVRAGVEAGAQAEGPQQGGDHARRGGLAVGAGHLDHRIGPLGLADQVHDRADARQGRVDGVLRPATEELCLEFGVALGRLGHVSHPSGLLLG